MKAALAIVLVLLAFPGAAGAATVSLTVDTGVDDEGVTARFKAAAGERNDLEVTMTGKELRFRDRGVRPKAGKGCVAGGDTVTCAASGSVALIGIESGDGDDAIHVARPAHKSLANSFLYYAFVNAGAGDDTVRADTDSFDESNPVPAVVVAWLSGGAGDDRIESGDGIELLFGGGGRDRLSGGGGEDMLDGEVSMPSLDAILGDDDSERQPRRAAPAPDSLDGGAGEDTLMFPGQREPVTVDLAANVAGEDTLTAVEHVNGGSGDDVITGDDGDNRLDGGPGDDRITGGAGDDVLGSGVDDFLGNEGPPGRDRLEGGAGDDRLDGLASIDGCGDGQDVVYADGRLLDAAILPRDCEFAAASLYADAAVRLEPVRRSRAGFSVSGRVKIAEPPEIGGLPESSGGGESYRLTVTAGGDRLATGRGRQPKASRAGTAVTYRAAALSTRRVKRVRVRLTVDDETLRLRLPVQ